MRLLLVLFLIFSRHSCWAATDAQADTPIYGTFKDYNVIMISLGNVGASRMSLYGYSRKTTPRLDAWAHNALIFESAITAASWTLPVGTSLFTSMYPYTHGIWTRNTHNSLDPKIKTLAE